MRPHYFDFARYGSRGPYARYGEMSLCEGIADLVFAGVVQIRVWASRVRARRELARLDLRALRDIGVTPSEAACECGKPFWRA